MTKKTATQKNDFELYPKFQNKFQIPMPSK